MNNFMKDLSALHRQGIIEDIDFEWCRFLCKQKHDISEQVLLAACLTSYLYRQGDVCLLLPSYAGQKVFNESDENTDIETYKLDQWRQELQQSSVVGSPGDFKPLILDQGDRLYLHKLWNYENMLAQKLISRSQKKAENIDRDLLKDGLSRLFSGSNGQTDWQQIAAALSVRNKLSIISGGPGTGKTSTVARILALLLEQRKQAKQELNIVLSAPTGKAAARLQESIHTAKDKLDISEKIRLAIPEKAMTLHQLLGARRHSASFKYNEDNPIPYDVIIVDEVSMVDQALMSKLVRALLTDTRLVLLGDKDQLASVEAGSVLGDICFHAENKYSKQMIDWLHSLSLALPDRCSTSGPKPLTDSITLLTQSYRFDAESGIAPLAKAINLGNDDRSLQLLSDPQYSDISLTQLERLPQLKKEIQQKVDSYYNQLQKCKRPEEAFKILHDFRILAAHRNGPWGIKHINQLVEEVLIERKWIPKYQKWYPGKPVIVNVNDYNLGLYNGDTGICLPDKEGNLRLYFQGEDGIKEVVPNRLPNHNRAYALTVHKSQGAEFNHILLVLPLKPSKIISRELIYTAVTRARTAVEVLSTEKTFRKGIITKIQRTSGLENRLWS